MLWQRAAEQFLNLLSKRGIRMTRKLVTLYVAVVVILAQLSFPSSAEALLQWRTRDGFDHIMIQKICRDGIWLAFATNDVKYKEIRDPLVVTLGAVSVAGGDPNLSWSLRRGVYYGPTIAPPRPVLLPYNPKVFNGPGVVTHVAENIKIPWTVEQTPGTGVFITVASHVMEGLEQPPENIMLPTLNYGLAVDTARYHFPRAAYHVADCNIFSLHNRVDISRMDAHYGVENSFPTDLQYGLSLDGQGMRASSIMGALELQNAYQTTAPINVDSSADAPDLIRDGVCASTMGECTLRAAVQEANDRAGHDTISLPAGHFILKRASESGSTTDIKLDDLNITDDLTLNGDILGYTIIDGNGIGRAFEISNGAEVSISNVVIRNGFAGANFPVTQNNSRVAFNEYKPGGAIAVHSNAELHLVNSTLVNNIAGSGGAISNEGTAVLTDVVLRGNGAAYQGGAIANTGTITMTDVIIANNAALQGGGGIFQDTGGSISLDGVLVRGNVADGDHVAVGSGGGLLAIGGQASLNRSTFARNRARISGGGASIAVTATVTVSGTTFLENNAVSDDAAGAIENAGGAFTATNSTFVANSAPGQRSAGAIRSTGVTSLRNVTIASNTGPVSLMQLGASFNVANSIIAGSGPLCSGTFGSGGNNLTTSDGCGLAGPGDQLTADPLLGPLGFYGGNTATLPLLQGSPAVDAGHPASPGTNIVACPAVDQRGYARPAGQRCDIGAFEAEQFDLELRLVTTSEPSTSVDRPLTFAFYLANDGPSTALRVQLAASLPQGLELSSFNISRGSCKESLVITCTIERLESGAYAAISITARAATSGLYTLTAYTSSEGTGQIDSFLENNTLSQTVTVFEPSGLPFTTYLPLLRR